MSLARERFEKLQIQLYDIIDNKQPGTANARLKEIFTDDEFIMVCLAYLTIIDREINEVIRHFLNIPSLIFIPDVRWNHDKENIPMAAFAYQPPLFLEVETLRNVDKEYYNFIFQTDLSPFSFRENAFKATLKLPEENFIHDTHLNIIYPDIEKSLNIELIKLNKEIWQILKDFQDNVTVREFYFLELLSLIMKEAIVNQLPNLRERLMQIGMIPELFLFPVTYHTRSIMSFARIEEINALPEDYTVLEALPNAITMEYLELNPEDKVAIPVMRYQSESGTLFFKDFEEHKTFCGTFYYFEPESTIYLVSDNVLMSVNKVHAAAILGLDTNYIMKQLFPPHREGPNITRKDVEHYMLGNVIPLNFYAIEDELDQIVCEKARTQGYKVVVFIQMVGTDRYVTEILDTRDRIESFKNLVHVKYLM